MKKVEIDPVPDQLLHIKNGYKIAAITWMIECIMKNMKKETQYLNVEEKEKVNKEVSKIVERLMNKRRKYHGLR